MKWPQLYGNRPEIVRKNTKKKEKGILDESGSLEDFLILKCSLSGISGRRVRPSLALVDLEDLVGYVLLKRVF